MLLSVHSDRHDRVEVEVEVEVEDSYYHNLGRFCSNSIIDCKL